MGYEIDGSGEEDAVFEVWEEEVFAASNTSDKAARVLGITQIEDCAATRWQRRRGF